jgi:acetyl esterase/lipase
MYLPAWSGAAGTCIFETSGGWGLQGLQKGTQSQISLKDSLRYLRRQLLVCTPLNVLNASVPTNRIAITRNIVYGQHKRKRLDVYRPSDIPGPLPVVVFFYGGKWTFGHREDYLFAGQGLASMGYVVVVADYRLFPEVRFPGFMHDAAAVVAWTASHIQNYRGDPDRIFVMGHSAGAFMAAKLAFNLEYLDQRGYDARKLKGLIGLSGPYDFLPMLRKDAELEAIFSRFLDSELSQPITFAHSEAPPTLLLSGEDDPIVWPVNSENLLTKLTSLGVPAEYRTYPNISHAGTVLALAHMFRWRAGIAEDVNRFLDRQSRT